MPVRLFCLVVFLFLADVSIAQSPAYTEQYRPQFHFSPPAHWMNDPNGMFFLDGEYHLFYQYYPGGNTWGPMHWGHAVSKNMVEWQHLPIALYPDSLGYIFSGSAVVDHANTSGLGKNSVPVIIAVYTYHLMEGEKAGRNDFQYQGIAYSTDKGRTWTKYEKNPVLPNTTGIKDFRDPKVFWHQPSKQWVMTLAVKDHVEFWGSPNLLQWNYLSSFGKELGAHGGVWECPDLFPMNVKETGAEKYVLLVSINPGGPNGGSATQYFVGDFNGKEFIPNASHQNKQPVWLDHGRDNYAGVTWSNIPAQDGRRLFLGWMSNWDYAQTVPTTVWRSAMTLPRSLVLHQQNNNYYLRSLPVEELKQLRNTVTRVRPNEFTGTIPITPPMITPQQTEWEIEVELIDAKAEELYLQFSNTKGELYKIGYNIKKNDYFSDRTKAGNHSFSDKFGATVHTAPRLLNSKRIKLHLFVDASSVELFADDGTVCMTELIFPSAPFTKAELVSEGGKVKIISITSYSLKRIWE
jgi:fructan beta-fructosidase